MGVPTEGGSKWPVPSYLLSRVAHVHCIINPIFQETPSIFKVWGGVLHHHQLCGVVDASQHCTARVPVKLQREPPGRWKSLLCGLRESWVLPTQDLRDGQALCSFLLSFTDTHSPLDTTRTPNLAGCEIKKAASEIKTVSS